MFLFDTDMNQSDATPDRTSSNVFRTPVNPKAQVWSPILHATTPDLNGPDSGCKGTPALIRSLGINPDLDTSWSSVMATPTNTELSLLGIKELDSPNDKSKVIQRRHLFPSEPNMENIKTEEQTMPFGNSKGKTCKYEEQQQYNKSEVDDDVLRLFQKPLSRFIYPEPIYINTYGTTKLSIVKINNSADQYLESEEHPTVFQQRRRNLKEMQIDGLINIRKLHNNSLGSASPSSEETNSQEKLSQEIEEDAIYKSPIRTNFFAEKEVHHLGEDFVDLSGSSSKKINLNRPSFPVDHKQHSRPIIESTKFSSGKLIAVSKNVPSLAKVIHEEFDSTLLQRTTSDIEIEEKILEEDLNDKLASSVQQSTNYPILFKVAKSSTNNETVVHFSKIETRDDKYPSKASEYPKIVGFSTASGKKFAISEESLSRAKNIFSKLDDEFQPDTEVLQTVGFNPTNGKKVPERLNGRTLLQDTTASKPNVKRGVGFKPPAARNKSPCKDLNKINQITPMEKKCAGFGFASGKNVIVSEKAMTRAKALIESVDIEPPSNVPSNTLKPETAPKKSLPPKVINGFHKVKEDDQVPQTVTFNFASGKNVKISESALSRAQTLYKEVNSAIEDVPQTLKIPKSIIEKSPLRILAKDESVDKNKKIEEFDDRDDDNWISSPTIGKKKKKNPTPSPRIPLTPVWSGTPSTFEELPTHISSQVLAMRIKARQEQKLLIQSKQKKTVKKPKPKPGYLYQLKKFSNQRKTLRELLGEPTLPKICSPCILLQDYGMRTSVCLVQASNASSFTFFAWEHFPIEEFRNNFKGIKLGEFVLIFGDNNSIGCKEIEESFLASENVDATLINSEWILNHYRWIVWKLASMELRMPAHFARKCLTPKNVLEQLKYRYDKEIDNCQRSALKRIIEQDDTPAKMMILCVAEIRTPNILELTDGWYSIDAHCDHALMRLVEKNKIFVGVKLAISGAELESPGPTSPLEKGSDTYLKISTNSTRRARWDSKLGFYSTPLPFPIKLTSVIADGGIVSHTRVTIIRVYPMIYMEKKPDGKTIFRGERQYRRISENAAMQYESMMEKIIEDIEREEIEQDKKRSKTEIGRRDSNVTDEEKRYRVQAEAQKRMQANIKSMEGVPMFRLRVVDWRATDSISAIISIWRPNEELQQHLKEGRAYHLYNVNAAGIRVGELQLNATKQTSWNEIKDYSPTSRDLERSVTSFSAANQNGFKPMFNELDVVGLVVYVSQQQTKDPFQTVVLSDGANYFGVKCWSTLEEYALADIIVVGAFLAFSNLQWRSTVSRTVSKFQFAFIHEGTLVSARPAQKHLDAALQNLKQSLNDPASCVAEADVQMNTLLGSTPQSITPKIGHLNRLGNGIITPTGGGLSSVKKDDTPTTSSLTLNRSRLLEKYGTPPALSPWSASASPRLRQKFKPPAKTLPPPM